MKKPVHFSGVVHYQFVGFRQSQMYTDETGTQVFVATADGVFGTPPNGTPFDTEIRLTLGASMTEDAYQVRVHEDLAELGARPEFAASAREYSATCMQAMFGPLWNLMTQVVARNNLVGGIHSPLHKIEFVEQSGTW